MVFSKIVENFLSFSKFILLSSITPVFLYLFSLYLPTPTLKFLLVLSTFFLIPFNIGRLIYSCFIRPKFFSNGVFYIFSCWFVGSLLVFLSFVIFSNIFYFFWSFCAFCLLLLFIPPLFDVFDIVLSKTSNNYCFSYSEYNCHDKDHLKAQVIFLVFLGFASICSLVLTSRIEIVNLNEVAYNTNYINSWNVKESLKIFYNSPFNFQRGIIPFEALLVAVSSTLSRVYPLHVYSYIGLALAFLYPFVIYYVVKYITRDKIMSLIISIISTFAISSVSLNFALCPGMEVKFVYPILTIFILDWINKHEKAKIPERMGVVFFLLLPCMMLIGANILGVLTPYEGYSIILRNLLIIIAVSLSLILSFYYKDAIYSIVTIFILINPLLGAVLLFPYFLLLTIFPYLNKSSTVLKRIFFLLCSLMLIALYFAIYYGLITFDNPHIISSIFHKPKIAGWAASLSPRNKIVHLFKYGPNILTHLGILGIVLSFIFPEHIGQTHERRSMFLLAFVALVCLYILIFPEGETNRISHAFTFFFPLFGISISRTLLKFLYLHVKHLKIFSRSKHPSKKKVTRQIMLSTILFLIFSSFLTYYVIQESPRIKYVNGLKSVNPDNIPSFYTKSEIRIFEWFFHNTPIRKEFFPFFNTRYLQNESQFRKLVLESKIGNVTQYFWFSLSNDTLVVSDPFTMASLNVMTLRDVLMPQIVFIYESEYSNYSLKFFEKLKKAFKTENSSLFVEEILRLKNELYGNSNKEIYVVVSKRTLTWLKINGTFVHFPRRTVDWSLLNNTLSDSYYFDPIYYIPKEVYVFKLKQL